jgi:hypothetical protein
VDRSTKDHLVRTWIEHHKKYVKGKVHEETFWAWEEVYALVLDEPDLAWELILQIFATDKSDITLANLAAGPLEDLLVHHGPDYIDRIEKHAAADPEFRHLLGGVWRNSIDAVVWERVLRVRGGVW